MCGALLCGLLYKYGRHLPWAYLGELFGTSVIGGLLSYPIAVLLMGNTSAALFAYVVPFFVSSFGGTILAAILVTAMKKAKYLTFILEIFLDYDMIISYG